MCIRDRPGQRIRDHVQRASVMLPDEHLHAERLERQHDLCSQRVEDRLGGRQLQSDAQGRGGISLDPEAAGAQRFEPASPRPQGHQDPEQLELAHVRRFSGSGGQPLAVCSRDAVCPPLQ
eukprot:11442399-Alexandrium_andersonii.AAC.1